MKQHRPYPLLWLAIAALATAFAPAAPARPLPPPVYPKNTPSQLASVLYTDLSGILRPRNAPDPARPMWWNYLSETTTDLHEQVLERDAAAPSPSFDYDWLCQCRNTHHFKIPRIVVEDASERFAELRVAIDNDNAETHRVRLLMVYENGWKLDDIVDEDGHRFSEELRRALGDRARGAKRLPDTNRP